MPNPFHEGELAVQKMAGEEATAERTGGIIGDRIMGGALPFLEQQTMVVFGSVDEQGRLWASLLFGSPGFVKSTDGSQVDFDISRAAVRELDPFWRNIESNPAVGMLAIELSSRRRLRVNGEISRPGESRLRLSVKESFPNCPKYITRRVVEASAAMGRQEHDILKGRQFGPGQRGILGAADAMFLATAHPTRGADASHRGGNPGFIEVLDETTLRIADYSGNGMFNSFGNLAVNPLAGVIVPDFERGVVLQMTGSGEVRFDGAGGTGRYLVFHLDEWMQFALPGGLEAKLVDRSPLHPKLS